MLERTSLQGVNEGTNTILLRRGIRENGKTLTTLAFGFMNQNVRDYGIKINWRPIKVEFFKDNFFDTKAMARSYAKKSRFSGKSG